MTRKDRLSGLFILVVALAVGWLWLSSGGLSHAPDTTFRIIDGRQISTQDLKGKPVLVTFWATTCPGCIKEMPHLIELYEEFSHRGFEIIGVAMAYDPPNQVLELVKRRQVPYPIALDIDGTIAKVFDNVLLTPTSFLISPDGRIIQHKIGEMDMLELRNTISAILVQYSAGEPRLLANH